MNLYDFEITYRVRRHGYSVTTRKTVVRARTIRKARLAVPGLDVVGVRYL
jgi:hypothetical protein